MKRAWLLLLVLATGCMQHRQELQLVLAESERILAEEQARADTLMLQRTEFMRLEATLKEGLTEKPELQKEIDALPRGDSPATTLAVLPMPPPDGSFEGPEGARLLVRIADVQARVMQLRKITGEVARLEAEKKRLEAAVKLIDAKRAK